MFRSILVFYSLSMVACSSSFKDDGPDVDDPDIEAEPEVQPEAEPESEPTDEPTSEPTSEPESEPTDEPENPADIDNDEDGYTENGGDCDDFNNTIYPGADEVPDNDIDEDCDGEDDRTEAEGIDGLANVQAGDLIITEIMNNPSAVDDSDGEWFEIYNNTEAEIDLEGLEVGNEGDIDFTVTDVKIPAGEHVVFGLNNNMDTNGGVEVAFQYSSFNLTNSDDGIVLSYNGVTIDQVSYDGGPTFPDPDGKSMSLNPNNYSASDNDNGANWCVSSSALGTGDFGTPGAMNDACQLTNPNDIDQDGYESTDSGGTDCDDNDPDINPGAVDITDNGIDEDCDGQDAVSVNNDVDGDGYESTDSGGTDCNDEDATINPDALDIGQDGIDQNCDGVDEEGLCSDSCSTASWNGDGVCDDGGPNADYGLCSFGADCSDCGPRYDNDGDGYYDDEGVTPLDTTLELDCDDTDDSINPGMADYDNDGIDQDCDGSDFTDGACNDSCSWDNDGYCDDGGNDANFSLCDIGSDCSDCGPRMDLDEDGYYEDDGGALPSSSTVELDCDDTDDTSYPGAAEVANDGIDQDCDGSDYVDTTLLCDNSCSYANDNVCDDGGSNSSYDVCALGTDCNDCGDRFDADGDGSDSEADCNDSDASINPNVSESCDGIDNNCNGAIDENIDYQEPYDADNPVDIGELDAIGDSVTASMYLTHEADVDAVSFYLYDYSSLTPPDDDDFECTVSAPSGVDIIVDVWKDGSMLGTIDQNGMGQTESFSYDALWLVDDEGTFTVVVSSYAGSSCGSQVYLSCTKQ